MDLHAFRNPPKAYRPMVRWWWSGLDVEKDELIREVGDLDDSILAGGEIQPFTIGLPQNMVKRDPERARRTHRFMQPYHYEMMEAVLQEAERRGMIIDVTQNSAWPTGGTHIPIQDSQQTLLFGETVLVGPREYEGPIPRLKPLRLFFFFGKIVPLLLGSSLLEYLPQDKRLVRLVAGKLLGKQGKFTSWKIKESALLDPDSMLDLTDKIDALGRLSWQVPDGRWQVFAFYEGSAGSYPLLDARSEPGKGAFVVDHLNRAALRRHLNAFLGSGEGQLGVPDQRTDASRLRPFYGKTLRAIFTDSFELISPMHWTHNFIDEFKRRRGYDVTPYLPAMYVPLKDVGYFTYNNELNLPNFDFPRGIGQRIRYDFQRTLSEMFIDEFICGAAGWAEENGLKSRVQGYGMMADPLQMLGRSHIPETEQLYGGGALHFLKLTGSAATLYNRPVATSESLVWSGRPYMTTPLKWRVGLDRLFESGINQAIYHGFPYRNPDFPYPGYQPFSSPYMPAGFGFSSDMSRDNPLLFQSAPVMNAYAARAQYLLQNSKTRAAVGIFYQLFDYPNGNYIQEELVQGVLDDFDPPLPKGSRVQEMLLPTNMIVTGERAWNVGCASLGSDLVANGYYYQLFNEDSLLHAHVSDRKAVMGEAEFSALLLYGENLLTAEAAEKLRELAQAGVPVLFVISKPDRDPGFFQYEERDERVRRAVAAIDTHGLIDSEGVVDLLKSRGVVPQLGYDHPQKKVGFIHKIDRQGELPVAEFFFLRSRSRKEQTIKFHIKTGGRVPVELDLWSGEAARLPFETSGSNSAALTLTLSGYTSRLVGLVDEQAAADLPLAGADILENNLESVLTLTSFDFSAQVRRADGSTYPVELIFDELLDWRSEPDLKGLGGPGEYATNFELAEMQPGRRYFLCFDQVCDRADITINGEAPPPLLVMPWRVEVTGWLKVGQNRLTIKVTPTLRNALVEFGNKGAKDYRHYKKGTTMPAGLIGPVKLCVL